MATTVPSISTDEVQHWADAFAQLTQRFASHFKRVETKRHAKDYWQGLLSSIERKNSWQIAQQVGNVQRSETPVIRQIAANDRRSSRQRSTSSRVSDEIG